MRKIRKGKTKTNPIGQSTHSGFHKMILTPPLEKIIVKRIVSNFLEHFHSCGVLSGLGTQSGNFDHALVAGAVKKRKEG